MLVSAMDNISDEKNSNSNGSGESTSVGINHELGLGSGDDHPEQDFEFVDHEEIIQRENMEPFQSPVSDIILEIDMTEIKFLKAIGKGSFGVVHKAIWGGKTVAVKKVETDTEVAAFFNEIRQLSRVKHDNIIQMYGTGTILHAKCLILEFAHDGSLYQFLHCPPRSKYNLSHALSWLLQCAKAIAYLHSIEPRPIIHRDLKPLNMLLTNERKVLKICDFGTACDLRSVMTDNKGSTAWMAPEVIKGGNYNEKCDVYSWGIILWELLTRRIPFEELGQRFRILWQVVNRGRPPLIQGCPKPIEKLMQRCWLDEQANRPSMQEVVDAIYPMHRIMSGGDELISCYSSSPGESYTESCLSPLNGESNYEHTSQDFSEFTTGSNTTPLDQPGNKEDQFPPPRPHNSKQNERCSLGGGFSGSCGNRISPNVSKSVVIGVENLLPPWGSATSDELPTPTSHSPIPPRSPCSAGRRTPFAPPPDMLTPLSIYIPPGAPAERNDVVLAQHGDYRDGGTLFPPPGHLYSPWAFPPQPLSSSSPSLSSSSPSPRLAFTTLYPSPKVASPLPQLSSPPLTSVATTLTFTPSFTTLGERNERSMHGGVPLRQHLPTTLDPSSASLRRRSAEVLHGATVSNPLQRGHRRSSSYESSKLIGFEPLLNHLQKEADSATDNACPSSQAGQRKKDKFPSEFAHRGEKRISEETSQSFQNSADDPQGTQGAPSSTNPFLQGSSCATGVSTSSRGPTTPSDHCARNTGTHFKGSSAPTSQGHQGPSGPSSKGPAATPSGSTENEELGPLWQFLEDDLRPTMPQPSCPESHKIFAEHNGLARQLLVVQEKIVYLDKEKGRLQLRLEEQEKEQHACKHRYSDKIVQLKSKKESLRRDYSRLQEQLQEIRSRNSKDQANKSSPDHHHHHQQPPSNPPAPSTYFSRNHPGQPLHPQQHSSQRQHHSQQYYYDHHSSQHHHLFHNH